MSIKLNASQVSGSPLPSGNHASLFLVSCFEEERRLDVDEKPLVVQLNWNKDDREGRFVLKNENDAAPLKVGCASRLLSTVTPVSPYVMYTLSRPPAGQAIRKNEQAG